MYNQIPGRSNPIRMMSESEVRLHGPTPEQIAAIDAPRLRGRFVHRFKGKAKRQHPLLPIRNTHQVERQKQIDALIAVSDKMLHLHPGQGKVASILRGEYSREPVPEITDEMRAANIHMTEAEMSMGGSVVRDQLMGGHAHQVPSGEPTLGRAEKYLIETMAGAGIKVSFGPKE